MTGDREQLPKYLQDAWDAGVHDACAHMDAVRRYNHKPPDRCPYVKGSVEEQAYDDGWAYAVKRVVV